MASSFIPKVADVENNSTTNQSMVPAVDPDCSLYLRLVQEHGGCEGMDRGVAPALHEEAVGLIQVLEVCRILLGPQEVEIPDLEIGPEVAEVVVRACIRCHKLQQVISGKDGGVLCHEGPSCVPQGGDSGVQLQHCDDEPVLYPPLLHEHKGVVVQIAVVVHVRLHAPVVIELGEEGVEMEEARVEAAHVVVRGHVRIENPGIPHPVLRLQACSHINMSAVTSYMQGI